MRSFVTLLKREWLESQLPFLWLPAGLLVFMIFVGLLLLMVSGFGEVEIVWTTDGTLPNPFFIDQWPTEELDARMAFIRNLVAAPFYLIYVVAALFVLLGTLYDERKDHSVLFWKSLPVTDYQTVASKLLVPVWIAPLVMIACAVAAQICVLALASVWIWSNELGNVGRLWWHAGVIGGAVHLLLGFFIQSLWVLPVTGYLLLVSATAPRLTLLWALLLPVVPVVLEGVLFQTNVISQFIARHIEPAALPNFLGDDVRIMPEVHTPGDQLALLANPDLWGGVLLGLLFLYGAVRMRGLNNEL